MDNRKNSFEFFGYDYMVDTDFRVWLIEVNSSPSMDMGTPTTAYLVQKVLADLPKVILDYPKARNQKKCDTGGFTCIYRAGFEVGRPQGVNVNSLICEGTALKPPKRAKKAPAQPTKTVTKPVQS